MTQKNPFALLTNLSVWLSGQCSPCRKRETQVITQQCGVLIDIQSLISVGKKKN